MAKKLNYRATGIRERSLRYGSRVEIDYVCTACLAIVPEPEIGCRHCKRKREKADARLAEFLAARKETA